MTFAATKPGLFTYSEYASWPDEQRWELIDGEAYDMLPAPTRLHQELVLAVAAQVHRQLDSSACRVYVAPFDVRLPKAGEDDAAVDTVVQPDVAVICDPSKLDQAGCRGAPDWVIEVLSPRTAAKDQILKRDLYERHGVREYWIVHPTDRLLIRYLLRHGVYGKPDVEPLSGSSDVGCINGLRIEWPLPESLPAY